MAAAAAETMNSTWPHFTGRPGGCPFPHLGPPPALFRCRGGYCPVGQVRAAAALLAETPDPTDEDIDEEMAGNICRCGTYVRIRAAIHSAAKEGQK